MSGVGQLLGALATAISVVFLALSLHSQRKSIELQMDELRQQREAMMLSAMALAKQIYIQLLDQTKAALDRYARALYELIRADIAGTDDSNVPVPGNGSYARLLISHPVFAKPCTAIDQDRDPILFDLAEKYCQRYRTAEAEAKEVGAMSHFEMAMAESEYSQLYRLLERAR